MAVQATISSSSSYHHHPHSHSSHNPSNRRPSVSSKRPARPAFKREKSANSKHKRVSIEDPDPQSLWEYDDMAASFPQFCTTCEKQIITPSNSILYCSEGCRRRDLNKPLSSSSPASSHMHSRPMTPIQHNQSFEHLSPPIYGRDIIPQRSPTAITRNGFSFTDLFSAAGSDLDDDGEAIDDRQRRPHMPVRHRRQESEAARYLRQFQSPSFLADQASVSTVTRRPKPQSRSSTMSLAPSLTHSPSPGTSPSSIAPLSSLPLATSRPLPSRINPFSSSYGAKSIGLVTPSAGTHSLPQSKSTISLPGLKAQPSVATNVGVDDLPNEFAGEELRYEKKTIVGSFPVQGKSTLRSLFRFEEMQAPPS